MSTARERLAARRASLEAWQRASDEQRRQFATYLLDFRSTDVRGEGPPDFASWQAERELEQPEPWLRLVDELALERASAPAEDLRDLVKRESES